VDLAHLFLLTDLLDHEFQAWSGFINLGTQLHTKSNLKHLASLILRRVLVKEPTTDQFKFTVFEDESTTDRFDPTISRGELTTDQFNLLN
jgi:hypothetical protein